MLTNRLSMMLALAAGTTLAEKPASVREQPATRVRLSNKHDHAKKKARAKMAANSRRQQRRSKR